MASGQEASAASTTLLKRLGEYKEFLAIVVAAVGGVLWLEGFVAKEADVVDLKADIAALARQEDVTGLANRMSSLAPISSVGKLECLLSLYMSLSQSHIFLATLNADLAKAELDRGQLKLQLQMVPSEDTFFRQTAANRAEELSADINAMKSSIQKELERAEEIERRLKTDDCGNMDA